MRQSFCWSLSLGAPCPHHSPATSVSLGSDICDPVSPSTAAGEGTGLSPPQTHCHGDEDSTICLTPKMTWERPFSCSLTRLWGPSQPAWPGPRPAPPEDSMDLQLQGQGHPNTVSQPRGKTPSVLHPLVRALGTAQLKGHSTPKSMENREGAQQGARPIWQQLCTRLKSIFDTQEPP